MLHVWEKVYFFFNELHPKNLTSNHHITPPSLSYPFHLLPSNYRGSVECLTDDFHNALPAVIDSVAPLVIKKRSMKKTAPSFNVETRTLKQGCGILECKWRSTNLEVFLTYKFCSPKRVRWLPPGTPASPVSSTWIKTIPRLYFQHGE